MAHVIPDALKECVIQTAKELTLKLIDKFEYPGSGRPSTLIGNQDLIKEAGEDFKILVTKFAEALKSL